MKIFLFFIITFVAISHLYSVNNDVDIQNIIFKGVDISKTSYDIEDNESSVKFNIAYSPFLPEGGVYSIIDSSTGKEAIIQIGYTQVNKHPYTLYLPAHLFNFFAKSYKNEVDKINLKLKFLAWNKEGEESSFLNLHRLIVKTEKSFSEILKNGINQYYIQLGAFSFFQNSYPVIIEMMPFLKTTPRFYMMKKEIIVDDEKREMYRMLAGPYSLKDARSIVKEINSSKNISVFIHSAEKIINEYGESDAGDK